MKKNEYWIDLYLDLVQNYIHMEYDSNLSSKIVSKKFLKIVRGYIKNCISMKKTVPFMANNIVKLIRNSEDDNKIR
jgi:hypothetical protein